MSRAYLIGAVRAFLLIILFTVACNSGPTKTLVTSIQSRQCNVRLPPPNGLVSDYVQLFSTAEVKSLDSLLLNINSEESVAIAVAAIDSIQLGTCALEQFSLELANHWGIGDEKKNNGILIVIVPGLRLIRIENGLGVEAWFSNSKTQNIIDTTIIPYFKQANYFEGIRQGILAIEKISYEKAGR